MFADVTHFSMVGYEIAVTDGASLSRSAQAMLAAGDGRGITKCTPMPAAPGHRACAVRDASGGELWVGIEDTPAGMDLVTMNPAYRGEGRAQMKIVADNSDPDWKTFEVGVAAKFSGDDAPVIFDLADPQDATAVRPGAEVTVSLAAFSYEPEVYTDEKAYFAAQKRKGRKIAFAADMFIPSGTFFHKVGGAMPDDAQRPTPYADFAGTILKAELKSNAVGGGKFWAVLVRTYRDATIDVVIDPASIKVEPKPGAIVSGRFWMSGHIVRAADAAPP